MKISVSVEGIPSQELYNSLQDFKINGIEYSLVEMPDDHRSGDPFSLIVDNMDTILKVGGFLFTMIGAYQVYVKNKLDKLKLELDEKKFELEKQKSEKELKKSSARIITNEGKPISIFVSEAIDSQKTTYFLKESNVTPENIKRMYISK